jgi:hypothetical protein
MVTLNESIREHQRAARDKSAKATQATAGYRASVREALLKGEDVTEIKDHTARYEAEAKAHESFAKDAIGQATRHGITLGGIFAKVAADTFAPAEKVMADRAEHVRATLASLSDAWGDWSKAWGVRRYQSYAAHRGGQLSPYHEAAPLPPAVAAAVQAISDALEDIDRLKADEAELTRWRKQNADAREYAARAFGQ